MVVPIPDPKAMDEPNYVARHDDEYRGYEIRSRERGDKSVEPPPAPCFDDADEN